MKITYAASTTIHADKEAVATFFQHSDLSRDYFPEVKKDISNMSTFVRAMHKNPDHVFPDYMVADTGFGWTSRIDTRIQFPNKDVDAVITAIDVEYDAQGCNTRVRVTVSFEAKFNTEFFVIARSIHAMVNAKLQAFKEDIETGFGPIREVNFAWA